MPKLLPTVQDVVNLAIGHERFLLRNTGLTNDSSQDHYVFNPQNVLANNRHLKSISQMEGQPNGDATTEGQSLQILGYIYMYRGTKEQYWLDRAIAMFDAYVDHFYQGQPIPDDPENSRWLCNWIINGKEPVLANWPIDFDSPTHSGFLGSPMTWTNGRTQIPTGAPNWGEYLDKATFAFDGALAWNTIVADVRAVLPDGSTDWNTKGTKWDVDWVVDYLGRKVDWDGNILEQVATLPKGTVQLKDTTVNGVHKLCYANCQPVEHGGYLIGRNEAWHNRPLRVPITKLGNLGNAADAELWFCDAAYQLWDITKEKRYYNAWRASWKMCLDYSNIDTYDKFFRQSTYDQTPWTDGISYDYGYPSSRVVTYSRDKDGYIVAHVDRAAQHTMEQQSVAYEIDDAAEIHINVGGLDINGKPLTVTVAMELADSKTGTETTGWKINLPDTPADGSIASYTIPMTSMSLANNPAGDFIIADNRVMSDWGNVTHTFRFEDNVYDTRSAQTCTSTVTSEDDGVIIGFWLTQAEKVIPSEIVYRTDETHEWIIVITDADNWRWHWTLPPSRIWDHIVLDPKDLRLNSYQADENGRERPLNPNLVAVSQMKIEVVDMLGAATADFSWYCVNDIPPTFAGHHVWTNTFNITVKGEAEFTMRLGDCDMINPNFNPLAYTPGVIPFSNNATEGIVEFDGWRGLPYPGYQHPFIYVHEKEDERLNNMINFMYDSQQAYFNKFGVLGPGAAAYVWNRWDNIKYGTPDTFTFYHWGDGHPWAGYQPRAFASAARAWHEMVLTGKTVPTKLILYVENWVNWLISYVQQYDQFPTDFPSEELPTPVPDDFTGHMTGLWLCGLSFAALCGSPIAKLDWVIEKAAKELNDNYYVGNVSVMNGSWSPAIRTGNENNTKNNSMFFGFWSGEILRGLGVYLMYRRGVPGEEMDILERTLSNLTQVGSGGVIRPDVTLKEDLTAVEDLANTAKNTADGTAELLETRVPEGRTINNKPLDEDLVFSPEDLDTYSRKQIDDKINAIVAGGYNPVRINGHLLDKDVILTPSDLGTFTGQEITTMVEARVPITRTINGKSLDQDITITPAELNAYSKTEMDKALNGKVSTTQTLNGKPLDGNVTLLPADINTYSVEELDTKFGAKADAAVSINGYDLRASFNLKANDVGALPASDAVPRTFKINGKPMTGTEMTLSGVGVTPEQLEVKLQSYVSFDNESGVATAASVISSGLMADNVQGSGFYRYAPGLAEDGSASNMTDRPTGSVSGNLIIIKDVDDSVDPAVDSFVAIAIPDDIDGVQFRKNGGEWAKFPTATDLLNYVQSSRKVNGKDLSADITLSAADVGALDSTALTHYMHTNDTGLIDTPIVMANNVAIRGEVTPGGGWKDILNMTPTGAMEVGSGSARLFLYSSNDPSVEIGGVGYKLYTEHFPPPAAAGGGAGGLLKVTPVMSSRTFSLQAGTKKILVEMVGGGGGSVNPPAYNATTPTIFLGSGGGAGGYAKFMVNVSDLKGTLNLVVGASGAQGGAGGESRVEILAAAGGERLAILAAAGGGKAGFSWTGTTVPAVIMGGSGGMAYMDSERVTPLVRCYGERGGVGFFSTELLGYGGRGGSNPMGCGASEATEGIQGSDGYGPGGGASGVARRAQNGTSLSGGVGGSGLIIISEYA